jgi:hypothetical protein
MGQARPPSAQAEAMQPVHVPCFVAHAASFTPPAHKRAWRGAQRHLPSRCLPPALRLLARRPELLLSWEWDFTELRGDDLVKLAYDMFIVSGLVEQLELRPKVRASGGPARSAAPLGMTGSAQRVVDETVGESRAGGGQRGVGSARELAGGKEGRG